MRKLALAAAFTALVFAPGASAQVINCHKDNRAAGTVIGAIVGGAAGGAIANNTTRRGFRGHGYRRGHGFHGRRFHRRGRGYSRRGNQEVGILLGAIAGGIIGNQVAASNRRQCPTGYTPSQAYGDPYASGTAGGSWGNYETYATDGPVDQNALKYGDPFGGRPVVRTPVSAQATPSGTTPPAPAPQGQGEIPLAGGVFRPICDTVFQTVELPDGTQQRSPVEVCQYSEGGEWIPTE